MCSQKHDEEWEDYEDYPEDSDGLKYDPKERDPKFKEIVKKA